MINQDTCYDDGQRASDDGEGFDLGKTQGADGDYHHVKGLNECHVFQKDMAGRAGYGDGDQVKEGEPCLKKSIQVADLRCEDRR